jgi:hypothetical protein
MKRPLRLLLPLLVLLTVAIPGAIADEPGHESLTGKLLVADTSMRDPRFAR